MKPASHTEFLTGPAATLDACYDVNGNQPRGWTFSNAPRDLSWTRYNLPKTVAESTQTLTLTSVLLRSATSWPVDVNLSVSDR